MVRACMPNLLASLSAIFQRSLIFLRLCFYFIFSFLSFLHTSFNSCLLCRLFSLFISFSFIFCLNSFYTCYVSCRFPPPLFSLSFVILTLLSFFFLPFIRPFILWGSRGSTVGWGTALQVGRSLVRFPMVSLEFFIDIILPAALWLWGWLSL